MMATTGMEKARRTVKPALAFILLMGIVSMLSDMTHEGARSIYGAYLSLAGASAATIGFVTGFGEFVGYAFSLVTGALADRTKHYWVMTLVGYVINVVAIPALALVRRDGWVLACVLIILERAGKAIRKPAKNTLVSFAASQIGNGKSFAIQEFLDQLGAFLGPVILFLVLLWKKGADQFSAYSVCFAVLAVPAVLTLVALLIAKRKFPNPENFEQVPEAAPKFHLQKSFLLYIIAISFFALGFIDFPLITMHVAREHLVPTDTLPLLYAGAMAVDAFAALGFGWLYDKVGIKTLMASTAISAFFAIFVFSLHSLTATLIGVALWGVGMGAQESVMKSAVSTIMPKQSRSTGFGIFEALFGLFWFLGSWLMGALYDAAPVWMVAFSVATQLIAIPLFLVTAREAERATAHSEPGQEVR